MLVVAGATLVFLVEPAKGGIYPPCPFHAVTGLFCPACGTLRGLNRLLHGDPAGAISMNALVVALLPFVLYSLANRAWVRRGGRPLPGVAFLTSAGWWVVALFILFGVLRNLPVEPFCRLAPG